MNRSIVSDTPVFTLFHQPKESVSAVLSDGVKIVTSKEIKTPFAFDSLVLSLNFLTETDGVLLLEAQVKQAGAWSKFYKLALFSKHFRNGFDKQKDEYGHVEEDILLPSGPAEAYRYRLSLYGDVEIMLLAGTITRAGAVYHADWAETFPAEPFSLEIEPISQMQMPLSDRKRICSPTALTMALRYFGLPNTVQETMAGVFDYSSGIYGNWIFNTAYAGLLGLESFVTRVVSLSELPDLLTPNSVLIASIAYKKGALKNAAIASTAGHLVLIQGYADGKIQVCDPAAPTAAEVSRFYDAKEFAQAWLKNKKGVVYIVRKK